MHGIWKAIGSFVRRADMILLSLCIAASVFGIVVISSATNVKGSAQYVRTQILALVLGIILYVFFTLVDVDIIAERRELLLIFSAIFILLLFPFGDTRSGNRSWLAFSFLPFSIQPAEICKIPFIMILAKTMSIRQNKISHISTVLRLAVITVFMFGLIVVASEDLGVALQYLFIFVIMAFVGGVSLLWFLGAFAVLLVASPFLWQFLSYDRRSRIWVLFDPRIDPAGEMSVSASNVAKTYDGNRYGVKAEAAGEVVRMVRAACKKPLMVKLSPQAENIPEMCKAVEAAGADAISLTNTFQACAIDLEKRRPVFNNIFAGLSGPAVRPIALRMVWQAVGAVNIPVVGLGGIATGRDALEFIMAGATAVQVGAANFANPRAMETIADEMAAWMDKNGVKTLDEIRGCARNAG